MVEFAAIGMKKETKKCINLKQIQYQKTNQNFEGSMKRATAQSIFLFCMYIDTLIKFWGYLFLVCLSCNVTENPCFKYINYVYGRSRKNNNTVEKPRQLVLER